MQHSPSIRRVRRVSLVVTLALGLGTLGAASASAREASGAEPTASSSAISDAAAASESQAGPFDLGGGLMARVTTSTRALLLADPATGLLWDSSSIDANRYGLGPGWTWTAPYVTTDGTAEVHLPGLGAFSFDASAPSGLKNYPGVADFVFSRTESIVPPRGDVPARRSFFERVSHGVTDYFSPAGDLITTRDPAGGREDRVYDEQGRLSRIVHADGRSTEIRYDIESATLDSPDGVSTTLWWDRISTGPTIGLISAPGRVIDLRDNLVPWRYETVLAAYDYFTTSRFEYDAAPEKSGAVSKIYRGGSLIYAAP